MSKLSSVFAATGNFVTIRILAVTLAVSFSLWSDVVSAEDEGVGLGAASSARQADASPWPVQVTDKGRTFLIYQPEVDKWDNNRLEGRSAVSVRNDAGGPQNFGVITFSARTELDQGSRTVTVRDAVVSKADFPAVSSSADDYLSVLRTQFAAHSWRVAQERLQLDMEIDRIAGQSAKQPLRNDPPRILYSERPAVLVPIDGNPVLVPVADSGLTRVINTRALILQDNATSRFYLFVSDRWMESPDLAGPWSVTARPPAQLEQAKQLATQQDQVDLLGADAGEGAVMPASVSVFVSTTPAELLQTDGPAQYAPIERTQLLYVTNSPNKLFLDLSTQNHYALISGRWYRSTTLAQGQWSYVPAASLPGDFAMIPAEHPTGSVRAAVPGTPQAREAVIANSVPQVATVARGAHLEITYDGNPVFQPIEGTVLQNAINAPVPVIRVSEASFYALDNGVWFAASSPYGPWTVASYVPAVIYSIPPSSPLYYVTYVRVYDATPEVVYVGYTPGYVGSYVSGDYVVVYGTGWPYRPWIGSVWYGAPFTWGFGFSFFYTWWYPYPWYSWHRVAWAPPPPCFRPWWGPWHAPVFGHGRPGFVAGARNDAILPSGSQSHNVGRIYDRWDRRSVVWSGPRAIDNPHRPAATAISRPAPDHGSGARPEARRPRLNDGGNRNPGRRDIQGRADDVNLAAVQTPYAVQRPPAVQATWRRPAVASQEYPGSGQPRVQASSFANVQQDRPAHALPQVQTPQRIPAIARVPIETPRAPVQRALPPSRSFSPSTGRIERSPMDNPIHIERPAVADSGRIERSVVASPGHATQHPSLNPGRIPDPSALWPQARGPEGRVQSNSGGGRGEFRAGERNR